MVPLPNGEGCTYGKTMSYPLLAKGGGGTHGNPHSEKKYRAYLEPTAVSRRLLSPTWRWSGEKHSMRLIDLVVTERHPCETAWPQPRSSLYMARNFRRVQQKPQRFHCSTTPGVHSSFTNGKILPNERVHSIAFVSAHPNTLVKKEKKMLFSIRHFRSEDLQMSHGRTRSNFWFAASGIHFLIYIQIWHCVLLLPCLPP